MAKCSMPIASDGKLLDRLCDESRTLHADQPLERHNTRKVVKINLGACPGNGLGIKRSEF
jgi:hypothetical protein